MIPGLVTLQKLREEGLPDDCSSPKDKLRCRRDTMVEFLATTLFIFSGTASAVASGRSLSSNGLTEDVGRIMPIAWTFGVSILTMAYSIGQ